MWTVISTCSPRRSASGASGCDDQSRSRDSNPDPLSSSRVTGFGQILADLDGAGVRYVLIGGIVLIRHGVVRMTRDIDVVLEPGERPES